MVCQALCLMLKSKAAVAELPFVRFHIECHDMKEKEGREKPHTCRILGTESRHHPEGLQGSNEVHAGGTTQPLLNHRRYL